MKFVLRLTHRENRYVEPSHYDQEFDDLYRAVTEAREQFDGALWDDIALTAQEYGREPINLLTPATLERWEQQRRVWLPNAT